MSKKINIMYINPVSEIGGSDISLLRILSEINKEKYNVFVALPSEGPLSSEMSNLASEILIVKRMRRLKNTKNIFYYILYLLDFLPAILTLSRFMKTRNIDMVHVNSMVCIHGGLSAKFANKYLIWHVREILTKKAPRISYYLSRLINKKADSIICISHAVQKSFLRGINHPSDNIEVVYDGLKKICPQKNLTVLKEKHSLNAKYIIGSVGRLVEGKGFQYLLESMRTVKSVFPDVQCVIVGSVAEGYEDYYKVLESKAKELGIEQDVVFIYNQRNVFEFYSIFDIFVHCSTTSLQEAFGLTVIEAMSVGTPVIATRAGGIMEIVEDGRNGILVNPSDSKDMAEAIIKLLERNERRTLLGLEGEKTVSEKYVLDKTLQQLEGIYRKGISQ